MSALKILSVVCICAHLCLGWSANNEASAFGPPGAAITHVDVAPSAAVAGAYEVAVEVENLLARAAEWSVAISSSAGWSARSRSHLVLADSVLGARNISSFVVELGAKDPKCPPIAAVVEVVLDDRRGQSGEVRERLYLKEVEGGLSVISYEEYTERESYYDSGVSGRTGCGAGPASKDQQVDRIREGGQSPPVLLSIGRTFTGQVVFWDSRNKRSNATGSRLLSCNAADTTCTANSANCCLRGVPGARVYIYRHPQGSFVGDVATNSSGNFSYFAAGEPDSQAYFFNVRLQRNWSQSPGPLEVQNSGGSVVQLQSGNVTSSTSSLNFPLLQFNTSGDTTSAIGDQVTLFVAGTEAFQALVNEGEDRHMTPGASGTRHRIRHGGGSNSTDCDDLYMSIQSAYSRSVEAVHLLGFLYLGDVVGCTGNSPSYPTYLPGGYDTYTAEGNALRVGIPSLLLTLSRWDPDTAVTSSIFSALFPCRTDGLNNANRASDERNNWHALWEFVDTDTTNTSGAGADYIDVTIVEVMDGVLALKDESGSGNHENGEQVLTEVPASVCFSSDDCANGNACVGYICYSGDPHGENIYDVVYRMAESAGGGFYHFAYYDTLTSSPCMGLADDSYPYTGAFRAD